MEISFKDYLISDDKSKIDPKAVKGFLAQSYWADQRSEEIIRKSIENSNCYGVYHEGRLIAFARVMTDCATTYYVCDVFVSEEYRGHGIGKKLVESIVNSEEYEGMAGLLGTKDAHGLYEQYGFERVPDRFMRRAPQTSS